MQNGDDLSSKFNILTSSFRKNVSELAKNASEKTKGWIRKGSIQHSLFGIPLEQALLQTNTALDINDNVPRIVSRCIEFIDARGACF